MMVLHPGTNTGNSSSSSMADQQQQKVIKAPLRRRRSKGTIAGFASSAKDMPSLLHHHTTSDQSAGEHPEGGGHVIANAHHHHQPPSVATSGVASVSAQPQHAADSAESLGGGGSSKPCHSARLALMCTQNAVRMGARTQLELCPPGRARRELQTGLRQRLRTPQQQQQLMSTRRNNTDASSSSGGYYYSLEKMIGSEALEEYEDQEEDYLLTTNTFEVDSDEEASSGDDDELAGDIDFFFSEESPSLDEEDNKYLELREPLFTPTGVESALSNPNGAPMANGGPSGKLPFNRRKIRYFDVVTATESTVARAYLRQEIRRSRKRAGVLLARRLKRMQREERRRKRMERGEPTDDLSETENEKADEKALLEGGVSHLQTPMTPAVSAALLIESLSINPTESVEGMAKCYDGIVAAGVALLDAQTIDPTSPPTAGGKTRPSRSEIMDALAPLLITSLEQPSGEVILMLAKLRRMCGTVRYQRRFVQRVAPCLIRPPNGAIWCLRHQNDMEAILAAAELIFDSAFDVFSKGWYERGQLLLADSKRAETLNTAAKQLRNLSSEPADGLALGLTSTHGNRRRLIKSSAKKAKDVAGASSEPLAEWEVIAVDRQIRVSISTLMSTDWSQATIKSEVPRPHYRRATGTTAAKRPTGLRQTSSAEMSPRSVPTSPRSPPGRGLAAQSKPQSPPHMPSITATSASDKMESVFGPAFSSQQAVERAMSPPPTSIMPASPPMQHRKTPKDNEGKPEVPGEISPAPVHAISTPPRSPKSPTRTQIDVFRVVDSGPAPLSPKRGKAGAKDTVGSLTPLSQSSTVSTPLSPSASSVGTTGSGEVVTYKPSTSASTAPSGAAPTAHYRMLTSTAAERKRTVAACRALRAQIQRFEDAFVQLHGRPPKGAAERAPLSTTYAQYREWKRAIRADAACRIQALFRGARTRWSLLRSNSPELTRIIMKRAGRSGYQSSESVINQISIPVEIGQTEQERSPSIAVAHSSGSESFSDVGQSPLAPQWASKVVRRRSSSGDRASGEVIPSASPAPKPFPSPPSTSASPPNPSEYGNLSLPELQARKRDLKQQLKQYDMNFARKHGRMPVKAEKEPIRHLYESYNALKNQISLLEKEGRQIQTPVQSPAPSPIPQRAVSPSSGSESGLSASEESPAKASPLLARSKRKVPKSSPPIASTPSGAPSQDLAALKAEKSQLHQMLRSYEKDFFKEHNRQVSSFADIKPVASQYRRYKEIKKAIAALQQQGS